jgi:pyrroloquinoline quinone biosynthesis protein B
VVVLGIAQDGGYPHIGCKGECCEAYWSGKESRKMVAALGVVDRQSNQSWLIEATPDIKYQIKNLQTYIPKKTSVLPDGIFITHAHIGHYTGLMELGREALGSAMQKVYTMPRMKSYLETSGPWSQLVALKNIDLIELHPDSALQLSKNIRIVPLQVPHRDEYSETVGFRIESTTRKVLFIPDIDKWDKWEKDIVEEISKVDYALLDGTFYKNGELANRDMSQIPHPFIEESIKKFSSLGAEEKRKIIFIHFNHTNPLIKDHSSERTELAASGFSSAYEGQVIDLK